MAGTNVPAVKLALQKLLKTAIAPVRVDHGYNGRLAEREYIYFGHSSAPQEPLAFRAGGRLPRSEEATLTIHLEVLGPGAQTEDTEARAVEIGQLVEDAIAADPAGTSLEVTGLLAVWVSNSTLTSFYASDGVAATEIVYTVTVQSNLG